MIYIDTSCLLKLFRSEPRGQDVRTAVASEEQVVVSELVELETFVQLKAAWTGGTITRPQWRRPEAEVARLRNLTPFAFRVLSSAIFRTALRQHRPAGEIHCRTLDRLHLAAMQELNITRLMTHDESQARAAESAGFTVIRPGRR